MEELKNILKKSKLYFFFRKHLYETKPENYHNPILNEYDTTLLIANLLNRKEHCMISRIGSNELYILKKYLKKQSYPEEKKMIMQNSAGVFPPTDATMEKFSEIYMEHLKQIDLLGVWFNPYEDIIANTVCPNAKLTVLRNLEPYFSHHPWSQYLADRKVLIIHPFIETITSQYKKREILFENKKILPSFELKTYKSVQSIGGNKNFTSWFDALEFMKQDITKIDFDVAIIGAGAYGLPLAAHIKQMDKKAIHLGGATQMLFGVYGKRWEKKQEFQALINPHWVKPSISETPASAQAVENACYW